VQRCVECSTFASHPLASQQGAARIDGPQACKAARMKHTLASSIALLALALSSHGARAVASDVGGRVARACALAVRGAPARKDTRGQQITHDLAERSTFVVKPDGRIAAAFNGLSPVDNVEQALATVKRLAPVR